MLVRLMIRLVAYGTGIIAGLAYVPLARLPIGTDTQFDQLIAQTMIGALLARGT